MIIVYYSMTEEVDAFVKGTGHNYVRICPALRMRTPYVLVTGTNQGELPSIVQDFLVHNHPYMAAISDIKSSSCTEAMKAISRKYAVPLLSSETEKFKEEVNELEYCN